MTVHFALPFVGTEAVCGAAALAVTSFVADVTCRRCIAWVNRSARLRAEEPKP